jgi:hypothetical protein
VRKILAIATISLAGLSFAPSALAQRHPDSDGVDHTRPDRVTMQRERIEWSRPSFDMQRATASERSQPGRPDATPDRPDVATRPTLEVGHMSPTTADAIRRVEQRSTGGGENDGAARDHQSAATQSANRTSTDATPPVQRMSATVAAAIERVARQGTHGGEDGASRSHDPAASHSDNHASTTATPPVQQPSAAVAAAMERVARQGAHGGEDGPNHAHDPVAPHSDNRNP